MGAVTHFTVNGVETICGRNIEWYPGMTVLRRGAGRTPTCLQCRKLYSSVLPDLR